jgi:hypothetical protein
MKLNQIDLSYFVRFVLLDETKRKPSKRQEMPMGGFWMSRSREPSMRVSDRRLRRGVCVEAYGRVGGLSISRAAAEVAFILGESSMEDVEVLRVEYYQCQDLKRNSEMFFGQFLSWRNWLLQASKKRLRFNLDLFEQEHDKAAAGELEKLFADVRSNLGQQARNREWLLELGPKAMEWIECRGTDDTVREKSPEELRILVTSHSSNCDPGGG